MIKATKIAVIATVFIATAPVPSVNAAGNVNQLVTNAINAGTILKWAISVEGFANFKTRPYAEYNTTKNYIEAAEKASSKLSQSEKLNVQARLVDAKIQVKRAQAYIDAITSSEKIKELTNNMNSSIASGELDRIEATYHLATAEYRKQTKLLDRVYGQSTRDGIRNSVKPTFEALMYSVQYDVTIHMHLEKAKKLLKEEKYIETDLELMKAYEYLNGYKDSLSFYSKLQNNYESTLNSVPLLPLFATTDGKNTVTVKLSKALLTNSSNLEAGQFKISGEIVQHARLSEDNKSVTLTTSDLNGDTDYVLTWKGSEIIFTTPEVLDSSGILLNDLEERYLETTDTHVYIAKLTNSDNSPYNGRVRISLANNNGEPTTGVITSVNGHVEEASQEWRSYADQNGHVVFTVTAGAGTYTNVQPTIQKLDGNETSKQAAVTHFYQLQTNSGVYDFQIENETIHKEAGYIVVNGMKYKWDANDLFFIHGQLISKEEFEIALTKGDMLTLGYDVRLENASTWNIVSDITQHAAVKITNPAQSPLTFDGSFYEISGTAHPGNKVKVYRNSVYVGMVTVDEDGYWSLGTVSLLQNKENTFVAYQYTPGQDGIDGEGAINTATNIILEGAFASTAITYHDEGSNGISITDTFDFSFLNPSYGHSFKRSLSGTLTINDGLGKSVVVKVDYIDENTLKVIDFISREEGFNFESSLFVITSTTGIINQDQLKYSVEASKLEGTLLKKTSY